MPIVTMTSNGRITIPIAIRNEMNLLPGSKVEFIPDDNGTWRIGKQKRSILELAGFIKWTGKTLTIDEMDT